MASVLCFYVAQHPVISTLYHEPQRSFLSFSSLHTTHRNPLLLLIAWVRCSMQRGKHFAHAPCRQGFYLFIIIKGSVLLLSLVNGKRNFQCMHLLQTLKALWCATKREKRHIQWSSLGEGVRTIKKKKE